MPIHSPTPWELSSLKRMVRWQFQNWQKGLPVAVKLPWDIIDAKNSHADRRVWTYPLKKTPPKAIVHKNAVLVQESSHQRLLGAGESQRLGQRDWGRGWGCLHLPEVKKVKVVSVIGCSTSSVSEPVLSVSSHVIYTHPVPGYCLNTWQTSSCP